MVLHVLCTLFNLHGKLVLHYALCMFNLLCYSYGIISVLIVIMFPVYKLPLKHSATISLLICNLATFKTKHLQQWILLVTNNLDHRNNNV